DVDDFKHVNDMKGHVTGDRLLCAIAERLRRLAGERVLAGHLMGDEFILFFTNETNRRDLETRMRRCHEQLRGNYEFEGINLFVSFSAGCVTVASDDFRLEEM